MSTEPTSDPVGDPQAAKAALFDLVVAVSVMLRETRLRGGEVMHSGEPVRLTGTEYIAIRDAKAAYDRATGRPNRTDGASRTSFASENCAGAVRGAA